MENASLKPSSWLRGTPMNRTEVHLYTSEFEAKDLLGQAPPPIPGGVVSPGFAPTPDPTTLDLIHDTTGTGRDIHLLQNDKYMQVPIPIRIRYGASVFFFQLLCFLEDLTVRNASVVGGGGAGTAAPTAGDGEEQGSAGEQQEEPGELQF